MNRFSTLLMSAVSLTAIATAAHAADAVIAEPSPAAYNWSGVYVGFGIGVGAVVHEFELDVQSPGSGTGSFNGIGGDGFFGELSVGYDFEVAPRFVAGVFADAHYGNIGPELSASPGINVDLTNKYGFDAGARLGYVLNPTTLGYVLGGYAWQRFELDGNVAGTPFEFDEDRDGFVAGVGMETAVSGAWTLKGEYRYNYYGNDTVLSFSGSPAAIDLNVAPSVHTFTVGANYRFGSDESGGSAIEMPAYNWTGFYVGGALGAGAAVHEVSVDGVGFDGLGGEGVFGEISGGYDHDFGNFVAGLMVDARISGIESKLEINAPFNGSAPSNGSIEAKADYGFDVLARAGKKMSEATLAYLIGGYSWHNFEVEASADGGSATLLEWDTSGFTIGGGLEAAVSNNITVGIEYRYTQFNDEDFGVTGLEVEPKLQTVRIGAKYKFN